MAKKRCSRCGNLIDDWGVCPVCERRMSTESRFSPWGRKPTRAMSGRASGPTRAPMRRATQPTAKPAAAPSPQKSRPRPAAARRRKAPKTEPLTAQLRQSKAYPSYTRQSPEYRRVCGFNRLLHDVYGQPVHLSHILLRQEVPAVQLFRWRGDKAWLPRYLRRLRLKLMVLLRNARPACDPFVINAWYALDGEGQSTRTAIAGTLQITAAQVDEMRGAFLAYLRSEKGRAALEKTIRDAAHELEKNAPRGPKEPHGTVEDRYEDAL